MAEHSVVIAPDSFKGSLSAVDVARAIAHGLAEHDHPPTTEIAPMADGGEGLLDAVATTCDGHWQNVTLVGVHGRCLDAPWYAMADGPAVLESAAVLGLPLIEAMGGAPPLAERSSYALGTLIADALDSGATEIAVGLGGSACNDAGLGMLVALGAVAYDNPGNRLTPSMNGLLSLARLDLSGLDSRLAGAHIRVLCDVDNPLLGESGASRIYGPQKGLTEDDIAAVEAAFEHLAEATGARAKTLWPGSGAAGGLGFALALVGGRLESGAEAALEMTGLARRMSSAACVITGEGRSDRQTLSGKLPLAVAKAAAPTPTLLVCGAIADDARADLARHFAGTYTLVERAGSVEAAIAEPARWLFEIGRELNTVIARL
ncbi:glycerate kinase [Salinisphaera sp.]|uniref:glycerate kinase n=1 Tax=Salinisphaera sp. TaxID=1914330 RepID=UPI002D77BEF8|nr:glycerate kinase [Salinisphaera sp.]HET7313372.1 glycerate kinase [Salinisphaera sp.]